MDKPLTYRIIALFFAFYLPLALVGVPLHKHYCEGELASFNFFLEAESCHEAKSVEADMTCCSSQDACHTSAADTDCSTGDCCDDEMELLKVDLVVLLNNNTSQQNPDLDYQVKFKPEYRLEIVLPHYTSKPKTQSYFSPFPEPRSRLVFQGKFLC